jgi:Family of unknown function (DUF6348)
MPHDLRSDDLIMWLKKLFGNKNSPAPAKTIDPMAERVAQALAKLLEAHGIACGRHDEWVTPNWQLPALRGHWHPQAHSGRLDIQVLVKPGLTIEESFAGIGPLDESFGSAMQNFSTGSLHVLLSALWDHDDLAQVNIEQWDIAGQPFTAVVGHLGMRGTDEVDAPEPPAGLFNALHQAICREALTPEFHWFRFYFGNVKGDLLFESLRDNEPWPAGIDALKSLAWPPTDAFYGARLFLVLKPATPTAP